MSEKSKTPWEDVEGVPPELKPFLAQAEAKWPAQQRLSDPALQAAAAAFRAPIASVPPQQDLSIGMGNAKEHTEATEVPQAITEDEVPRVEVNLGDDMPRELPEGRRSAPTVETKIPKLADLAFEAPVIREKETPPAEPVKTITGTLQLPKPGSEALNATTTPRPEEEKKPGNKRAIIGLAIVMVGAAIAFVVARMPSEQNDGASAGSPNTMMSTATAPSVKATAPPSTIAPSATNAPRIAPTIAPSATNAPSAEPSIKPPPQHKPSGTLDDPYRDAAPPPQAKTVEVQAPPVKTVEPQAPPPAATTSKPAAPPAASSGPKDKPIYD